MITNYCCLYSDGMYKNTVSARKKESAVVVRVRKGKESEKEARLAINVATKKAKKLLIFPNEELLVTWRLRLAALA